MIGLSILDSARKSLIAGAKDTVKLFRDNFGKTINETRDRTRTVINEETMLELEKLNKENNITLIVNKLNDSISIISEKNLDIQIHRDDPFLYVGCVNKKGVVIRLYKYNFVESDREIYSISNGDKIKEEIETNGLNIGWNIEGEVTNNDNISYLKLPERKIESKRLSDKKSEEGAIITIESVKNRKNEPDNPSDLIDRINELRLDIYKSTGFKLETNLLSSLFENGIKKSIEILKELKEYIIKFNTLIKRKSIIKDVILKSKIKNDISLKKIWVKLKKDIIETKLVILQFLKKNKLKSEFLTQDNT